MQEEYYNVGLSYELFLRAFGELDIIHEDQITDETLNGYRALVLCDVKMLPEQVAQHIKHFVERGGTVIADCVPHLDENRKNSRTMSDLFGVCDAGTERIIRAGQWVPFVNLASKFSFPPTNGETDSAYKFDTVTDVEPDMQVVSSRPCKLINTNVQITSDHGVALKMVRNIGQGHAILFGFCMQDTYFHACKTENEATLCTLYDWVRTAFDETGVISHVRSSNPDIEVGLRSSNEKGYLFVINHETFNPYCNIQLRQLPGCIAKVNDVETGVPLAWNATEDGIVIETTVAFGKTQLIKITYQ